MMSRSIVHFLSRPASKSRFRPHGHWNVRLTLSLLSLTVLSACGAAPGTTQSPQLPTSATMAPAAAANAVTVSIKDFKFSPQTLTVAAGTTVTWKNLDDEPHTVRGADELRSSALDQSESYSVKFDKPGTYKYGCSIHPKMSGTIIVK
jgi:plastocyanin